MGPVPNQPKTNQDSRSQTKKKGGNTYKGKSESNFEQMVETLDNQGSPMSNIISTIFPENLNDYLNVTLCLSQIQNTDKARLMKTRETRRKIKKPPHPPQPNTDLNEGMEALAQIDTGNQVGDVINRRVLTGLGGTPHLRIADVPLLMCSGLDATCIESTEVLDIVVSFNKNDFEYKVFLSCRIAESSEVDLIIGLKTIKDLNLVKILPEFFQHQDQIDQDNSLDKEKRKSDAQGVEIQHLTKRVKLLQAEVDIAKNSLLTNELDLPQAESEIINNFNTITPSLNLQQADVAITLVVQNLDIPPVSNDFEGSSRIGFDKPVVSDDSTGECNEDTENQKPTSSENRRQDKLGSRGACKKKSCTFSCGCYGSIVAAATVLSDEFILPSVVTASALILPQQDELGFDTDSETELATPITSFRTPDQTHGLVAALLREEKREALPEVQPFDSEGIDYKSKDTFAPFTQNLNSDEMSIINMIQIEGSPTEISEIRDICIKHKSLFKNILGPEPARIPAFQFRKVDHEKWNTYKNRCAPRVTSTAKQDEIRKQIEGMLATGIIRPSAATHYSQVILAPKPDGSYRFCIDYRNLNDATESASWPIPHIKTMLARLGAQKADTFGVIDLTSGYHQAPLTMEAQVYTAFITFMGIYNFTRLPFGPKMAPSYFQEMMASVVLAGLIYRICEVYLDDIIIYGNGHREFCERLDKLFQRLREKNISLKAAKIKLGLHKVEYVGREISKDGITMSSKKIKGVTDFPMPRRTTELRSFLGLANYFRDHVPNHSNVVAPLHHIIDQAAKKQTLLQWTDDAATAFTAIKGLISESPLLYFMDDKAPITLMTDASDYGIGGYLYQEVDGVKQLVALVSRSLTRTQLKWSTIQKEAYALYYCCDYLDALLRDRKFTILTDHKNLTFINKETNQMVGRWRCALQELDFTVEYVKGKDNEIADAMSRLCINQTPTTGIVSAIITIKPLSTERYALMTKCHNTTVGHGGVQRTLRNLKKLKQKWTGMRHDVKSFIDNCPCCQKLSTVKYPVNAHRFTTSTYKPMECLNIDFIGPFPDKGYILVMIDTFTRFVELTATPDATAKSACTALIAHIGRYGAPIILRSDNGAHFANTVIDELMKIIGTTHNRILAYSSEENSIVERANKEINRHIRAYTYDRASTENYQEILPFVQRILNSTVNDRMKISPAEIMYGRAIDIDSNILIDKDEMDLNFDTVTTSTSNMLKIQDDLIKITAKLLKESDDLHNANESSEITEHAVDSYVLVKQRTTPETRMHTLWRGPMRVVSNDLSEYTLRDLVTHKELKYHLTQIKPFHFDPILIDPTEIARRDYLEFFIEEILDMHGDIKLLRSLTFHVKWLNYPHESNTWEPWVNIRKAEKLHKFLILKNLRHLIPREFKANYD